MPDNVIMLDANSVQCRLTREELQQPAQCGDNPLFYDEEIPQSDTWSMLEPVQLGAVMAAYIKENPNIVKLTMPARGMWIAKKYAPLQRVVFPDGLPSYKGV